MIRLLLVIGFSTLLLSSCIGGEEEPAADLEGVRGATLGVAASYDLAQQFLGAGLQTAKPSAGLGVYVSMYLTQGILMPVASAREGIEAQMRLLAAQDTLTESDTFVLLTELATLLQVDIPDMLNRSINRAESLNQYVAALRATGEVAEQKFNELETREEQLREERREQRNEANEIEREINRAFRDENYTGATQRQEELIAAETTVAETEIKLEQTQDIIRRYEDLLEIADDRLQAIIRNREALLAGVKVTEMPGVESLDVLEENYRRPRRDSGDIFGTDALQE